MISSSKGTTRGGFIYLSSSRPCLPSHPAPSHLQTVCVEGRRARDGLSWVNPQGAWMAGGWKAGGQLCCLLGLSPCWAMIKSRPWCEAFCWGGGGLPSLVGLGCVPERKCYKEPGICFLNSLLCQRTPFFSLSFLSQIHQSKMSHTCSESQVVIVNLLDIKHKIRLGFWCSSLIHFT